MVRPNHLARMLLAAFAALAAQGAAAQQGVLLQLYPLTGDAKAAATIAEAQALLEAAVPTAVRRSSRLTAASPLVIRATCGRVPGAECLAPLAEGGVVVWGTARKSGEAIVVTLHAVDAKANVHGPVQTKIDAFLQNAEPIVGALLELEGIYAAAAPAAPSAKPLAAGARSLPGTDDGLRLKRSSRRSDWQRTAGKWSTGLGLLVLAGGATVAVLNQQLAADLTDRYRANTLTTADASQYDRMDTYNELSKTLFIAGGALTATGVVLWGLAPDVRPLPGGMTLGLQGRF